MENEKWYVLGYRDVNFTDKESGQIVNGYTLYLTQVPGPDQTDVHGEVCQKLFISSKYVSYRPNVGDEIVLFYNRYGKVGSVQVV